MAAAIQTVPSVIAVNWPPALWAVSPLTQRADSLFIAPSVIATLGGNSPVPVTYNSAGLFDSSTTADLGLLNAATAAPVDTTTATPATIPTTAATAVSNAPSAPVAADTFLPNSVAQAEATIEGNPAYAIAAAGLYMNAMIFHLQQSSATGPTISADSVQPVTAPANVSAVKLIRR